MINVLNEVKELYKDFSTNKTYLISFRNAGIIKQNADIVSESLHITESICSASKFKVGLCEAATASVSVHLADNVKGDEMFITQILGSPEIDIQLNDDGENFVLSGDGIRLIRSSQVETYDQLKYYIYSCYAEYIGKPIYIYSKAIDGSTRVLYYLRGGLYGFANLEEWQSGTAYDVSSLVLHNDQVWRSRTTENDVEPQDGVNSWENITIKMRFLIPVIGSELSSFYRIIYTPNYTDYTMLRFILHEIDFPVMSLGIYNISSCKKKNDSDIRDIQGYGRMEDAALDVVIPYEFNINKTTIGEVLNIAAEGTQIIVGSNLSRQTISAELVSETVESVPNFPTGALYAVDQVEQETASGSRVENVSGARFSYRTWTTRTGTYEDPVVDTVTIYSYDAGGYYDWYLPPELANAGYTIDAQEAPTRPGQATTASKVISPGGWIAPATPSGYTFYRQDGYTYYYYKDVRYDFTWPAKYSSGGWYVVSETHVQPDNTRPGTCTRVYRRVLFSGTWSETVVGKRSRYRIPNYNPYNESTNPTGFVYEIYVYNPTDFGAIVSEESFIYNGLVQNRINAGGVAGANNASNHQLVRNAIYDYSTHEAIIPDANGYFEITYVSQINYTGADTGTLNCSTLYRETQTHSSAEKFNDEEIGVIDSTLTVSRRDVITGYLELNGLFINFDRYGISTFLSVSSSTLYPAENIFPHNPETPIYGIIYPTEGAQEILSPAYCKSLYIDDEINPPFDGIAIISDSGIMSDNFYYNRLDKKYGVLPAGMPEMGYGTAGYWPDNNYYEIQGNFFFNNFTFTTAQLKDICKNIIERIGNLQYFNLSAEIIALPYMEPGDNINIMTPKNGYETAILRRRITGCQAQIDSLETDFY